MELWLCHEENFFWENEKEDDQLRERENGREAKSVPSPSTTTTTVTTAIIIIFTASTIRGATTIAFLQTENTIQCECSGATVN